MNSEDRLDAIERRLGTIEECVKDIRKTQTREQNALVKQLHSHITDLKEALRAITSMAEKIKSGGGHDAS